MNRKKSIVVFISGNGSKLQAIIDKIKSGELDVDIKLVISNKSYAYGLERAKKAGIPTEVFSFKEFQNKTISSHRQIDTNNRAEINNKALSADGQTKDIIRQRYCAELALLVKKYNPDLVVLAGWMLILKNEFLNEFPMREFIKEFIFQNQHPASQ